MDWSNERYVRLYVRDTRTWLKLRWEGQCLFMLLLRKVDRAGVLDDIEDPADDLSLMTGFPVEHVEPGINRLLTLGVVEINNGRLVIPNFIEAQESSKSDAQRQRECRERRRDGIKSHNVTDESRGVTETSQPVTTGHELSQGVTLTSADPVLCSTDPVINSSLRSEFTEDLTLDLNKKTQGSLLATNVSNLDSKGNKKRGRPKKNKIEQKINGTPTWEAYSRAYEIRYGTKPVRNAQTNSLCKQLVERLGYEEAPLVAAHYLSNRNSYHVGRGHSLKALVGDCEKIRTEWATGVQITQTKAREEDRLEKRRASWQRIIDERGEPG